MHPQKLPSALISGNVVDGNGLSSFKYVLVDNGRIVSVSEHKPKIPSQTIEYNAGQNSYIFPGLINLHTHIDYNLLPMWLNPHMYGWDNRFEWRANDAYHDAIRKPISYVRNNLQAQLRKKDDQSPNVGTVFQALSEIQAVAGGTTILQENTDLDEGCHKYEDRKHILIRNTGTASDMGLEQKDMVGSHVDFYEPSHRPFGFSNQDTSNWLPKKNESFDDFVNNYKVGTIKGTLVHLAEGRSGVGLPRQGVDAYTRNEFNAFRQVVSLLDPKQFNSTHFGIIHGCGIDAWSNEHIAFLKKYGIDIIWSPVSNMLLYGDTIFTPQLQREGVLTCLGSDWSPSGTKHVWEEAKFARYFFDVLDCPISNLNLFKMITTNPAQALNIPAGSIEQGNFADFFILHCDDPTLTPLEALFRYDDKNTQAVITAGVPVYGCQDVFSKWQITTAQRLPKEMGEVASSMFVNFPPELNIDVEADFHELKKLFQSQGVSEFSLPLVADDTFYQSVIANLKKYTMSYRQQVRILSPNY
ncbi:MAG: amidohydrolase family protein [Symploca sp. SIO1B1]|nr:amidohydrolase family protein [Symploca sp. SIO1B1]